MTLSVIITCYKMEKFIEEVIKSVLNQEFGDIEIIVIDDGSPDRCADIVKTVFKDDERVRLVQKENGGPGSARNAGIRAAKGDYIFFLDGDDRMVEGTLNEVYKIIKESKPDIITCTKHLYTNWEKSYIRENLLFKPSSGEEKKLAEDQEWLMNNVSGANKIEVVDKAFYYHYERRPGSQVNGFDKTKMIPTAKTWAKMFHDIDELNYSEHIKQLLKSYTCGTFWRVLIRCNKEFDECVYTECNQLFWENKDVIYSKYNKCRNLFYLAYIIGVHNTLILIGYILKLKK